MDPRDAVALQPSRCIWRPNVRHKQQWLIHHWHHLATPTITKCCQQQTDHRHFRISRENPECQNPAWSVHWLWSDTMLACDRQTDRQTYKHRTTDYAGMALCGYTNCQHAVLQHYVQPADAACPSVRSQPPDPVPVPAQLLVFTGHNCHLAPPGSHKAIAHCRLCPHCHILINSTKL